MVRRRDCEGCAMESQNISADEKNAGRTKTARLVGRGILVITGANLVYGRRRCHHFRVTSIFDRIDANGRALYGQYSTNILSIFSMMMVTG